MIKLISNYIKNHDLRNYILSEIISKLFPIINIFLFLNFLSVKEFGELARTSELKGNVKGIKRVRMNLQRNLKS